jgi:predicted AlkP superfamily pyrophosphatase or phosphodiesterase
MHERVIPYRVWDWSVPEDQAWTELREAVGRGTSPVLFLYSSGLDSLMHLQGTRSDATRQKLRELDQLIRSLVADGERVYGEVRLFVFGDHGMTDVTKGHDLWSILPEIGPPGKRGVLYFLDSTMARFWFDSPSDRERVEGILSGLSYRRSLSLEEEKDLGVYFPDRRYGDLIFVLEEGHVLVPSFMGRTTMTGMHGYHPDEGDSSTTLLTNTDAESPKDVRGLAALLKEEALGSVES